MKVLLVQTSFLGDTILSTPLFSALHRLLPGLELWFLTTPTAAALVQSDPLLKGVLVYDKRGKDRGLLGILRVSRMLQGQQFERVYSLHRSFRTSIMLWLARIPERIGFREARGSILYHTRINRAVTTHEVLRNLSLLGPEEMRPNAELRIAGVSENLPIPVVEEKAQKKKIACIFPGSAWETKRWNSRHFQTVANYLIDQDWTVVLLGAPSEAKVCAEVGADLPLLNLCGQLDLASSLAVVKSADLVVCNDSMALHAASAFKIPTIAVFCATSPKFGFGPWRNRAIVVEEAQLVCKPCSRHGERRCPLGDFQCSTGLEPKRVIEAIESVLGAKAHG